MPAAPENPIDKIMRERPLTKFSFYTVLQVEAVRRLAAEIRNTLNEGARDGTVHAGAFQRFYDMFWFWVLGAYEIVRTMDQAKGCFSDEASARIGAFKRRIVVLRIPFAKLEHAGEGTPITNEASVHDIDTVTSDVFFVVKGQVFSVRTLLDEFDTLMAGISASDVLMRREAASKMRGRQKPAR